MLTKNLITLVNQETDNEIYGFLKTNTINNDNIKELKTKIKNKILCNQSISDRLNNVSCHSCGN